MNYSHVVYDQSDGTYYYVFYIPTGAATPAHFNWLRVDKSGKVTWFAQTQPTEYDPPRKAALPASQRDGEGGAE